MSSSVGADMTTLFLAVAFLVLGSLALPMALRHVPAATEHAAAAASQISAPGRMTYMGSRIAGTTKMMGGSRGGSPAIVRQAGAMAGPLGVAATAGAGAAASVARSGVDAAGSAADAGGGIERTRDPGSSGPGSGGTVGPGAGAAKGSGASRAAATGSPDRSSGAQSPRRALVGEFRGAPGEGSAVRGARGGTSRG